MKLKIKINEKIKKHKANESINFIGEHKLPEIRVCQKK